MANVVDAGLRVVYDSAVEDAFKVYKNGKEVMKFKRHPISTCTTMIHMKKITFHCNSSNPS